VRRPAGKAQKEAECAEQSKGGGVPHDFLCFMVFVIFFAAKIHKNALKVKQGKKGGAFFKIPTCDLAVISIDLAVISIDLVVISSDFIFKTLDRILKNRIFSLLSPLF
jgi:hypothetical protein